MSAGKTEEEQPEQWDVQRSSVVSLRPKSRQVWEKQGGCGGLRAGPRSQASSPRLQQRSESPSFNRVWQHTCLLLFSLFLLPLPASVRGLRSLSSWQASSETQSWQAMSGISNDFETTLLLSAPSFDVSAASSQGQCCSFSPNHGPKTAQPLSWGPGAPRCSFCSVHPVSVGNWCPEKGHHFQKFPLSHSYHIPAAQPGINPQFHVPGILALAVDPQGLGFPPAFMYIDGRWGVIHCSFLGLSFLNYTISSTVPSLPPYHGHSL